MARHWLFGAGEKVPTAQSMSAAYKRVSAAPDGNQSSCARCPRYLKSAASSARHGCLGRGEYTAAKFIYAGVQARFNRTLRKRLSCARESENERAPHRIARHWLFGAVEKVPTAQPKSAAYKRVSAAPDGNQSSCARRPRYLKSATSSARHGCLGQGRVNCREVHLCRGYKRV